MPKDSWNWSANQIQKIKNLEVQFGLHFVQNSCNMRMTKGWRDRELTVIDSHPLFATDKLPAGCDSGFKHVSE
jgi:hypothetical protein